MIKLKKKSRNHSINSNLTIDWKVFLPKNARPMEIYSNNF